ncbi:HAD-IA family hydrolase [Sphingomonas sp. ID0503]|uniref:HAD-IA family hydrolase n=1 Tax=Sphingomonas sp. ID0503 TaxID=3399691 RepID=UPI003AFB811D
MNRLAVFDCDGTLVDSQAHICSAMEACFASAGLAAPSRQATRRVVGLSLVEVMQVLHPDGTGDHHVELAEGYKRAFQTLRAEGMVHEPLFDGVGALVEALDDGGWLLGIATGKSDRGLNLCLAQHGLLPRFVTLQTADRHPSKPHPAMLHSAMAEAGAEPETTVMIGDTSYDMEMARNAGVRAIGVAWGYHDAEELIASGAEAVARDAEELAALLKVFA